MDHQLVILGGVAQLLHLADHLPRDIGKQGRDHRPGLPAADDAPGGAGPQHRVDGADEDGLTGAGFPGEYIEAVVQLDGGLLNHRDILNIKLGKHGCSPPFLSYCLRAALAFSTVLRRKSANSSAWRWVRSRRKMVSSPAMVPTSPSHWPVSTATQTALAMPE